MDSNDRPCSLASKISDLWRPALIAGRKNSAWIRHLELEALGPAGDAGSSQVRDRTRLQSPTLSH